MCHERLPPDLARTLDAIDAGNESYLFGIDPGLLPPAANGGAIDIDAREWIADPIFRGTQASSMSPCKAMPGISRRKRR